MSETSEKTLVERLAEACDAVGGIEKKGRNTAQNYAYVKAADVAKAIRHELFKRGVVVLPNEVECSTKQITFMNAKGETRHANEVTVKTTYVIKGAGETIEISGYGIAWDSGDKGIYKAKTGALKYFLRGLGLIPDEKDDPEADEKIDKALDGATFEQEFDKRTEGQRVVGDFQVRAWESAAQKGCRSQGQIAAYFKKIGISEISHMHRQDFNEAIKWLLNPKIEADLTETLKESVEAVKANGNGKKPVHTFPKLFAEAKGKGIPETDVKQYAYETFKIETLNDLSPLQFKQLQEWIGLMA